MKIISWNCRGATDRKGFSKDKLEYITNFKADIYVIQECKEDDIDKLDKKHKKAFCDGIDSNYGIGVFSDKLKITIIPEHNKDFRYLVPFKVSNDDFEFILFAVWTKEKDKENKKTSYTRQVWDAINFDSYIKHLSSSVLLIGDFNSNNRWETDYKRDNVPSHQEIIDKLFEYDIESAYHKYYKCENGKEKDPTELYMMDINKKYHVDYCFLSNNFKLKEVKIGNLTEWANAKYSDHCPISVEFDL